MRVPAWLNLGLAKPAPRGALAVAPWLAQVPANTLHSLFTRIPRSSPGLIDAPYSLIVRATAPGQMYGTPAAHTPLIPNPYSAGGGGGGGGGAATPPPPAPAPGKPAHARHAPRTAPAPRLPPALAAVLAGGVPPEARPRTR